MRELTKATVSSLQEPLNLEMSGPKRIASKESKVEESHRESARGPNMQTGGHMVSF